MQGEDQAWVAVDAYFAKRLIGKDPLRSEILETNAAQGLPPHDVSPLQGRFLSLLVKATGARRILEIGTLGGVSATWMAQALPAGGQLISLEVSPDYAALARQNLDRAGIGDRVQILVGPALESLARLAADACAAFDLVFIDADKPNNPAYLDWALKLTRPGGLIIGDNVVRGGAVLDPDSEDDRVRGVRTFTERLGREPRLFSTALQTVGEKGWDGMTLSFVEP
ncbi:MAG: O-methyltransferase [Phenylobacterium sp.]|jgi:SAM-dependent methyltransferase|uniref:O-methyltransferase n=1 Tax=Phenylobacterium sp. TaxID=1871053 RepID=UPI00301A93D1